MRRLPRSPLFLSAEYLLAILLVGLVTGVLHLIRDMLNVEVATVLYLLPVVISTLLWGLGPGVAAALAAFFAFNYFFIEPRFHAAGRTAARLAGAGGLSGDRRAAESTAGTYAGCVERRAGP